ncbi:DUF3810 domain-containing protein [Acetivibrio mesophilus]|uniref:DUF3810 domain-containing protein n=1 Tax=Acetivibrio mesophilus TaxID=2487273 RepID=A0A4V1K2E4_9FIRM|nr:DUF3810 domain-containing protein [Acetivibrio mesophilus]ODM25003.1 hypothetical protein A7W90_01530 [Clostridium sp. Bc-iso-3]RXE59999.1 DUF3810 domain-containing protein [Acetivibrio mesophilus]HHV29414.1 DUF3810 domain-containing protein [Clostridium sp.]
MNIPKINKKLFFILLIPIAYLMQFLSSRAPYLAERIYSRGAYRLIAKLLNLISGYIPVSIAEILVILSVLFALFYIIKTVIKMVKSRSEALKILGSSLVNALTAVSLIYFSFMLLWGINYQRLPFSQIANYDTSPASIDELLEVCENLTERANELRKYVKEDDNGVMKLSTNINETLKRAYMGYETASKVYPELSHNYGRPKGVIMSEVMSYLGIGGVYFPFTGEANINISLPSTSIPFTTCHEMAHQIGFAREDEANFIAYIACRNHPSPDFQYSGTLSALINATNALYRYNQDEYFKLRNSFSEGIIRDLTASNSYWEKYETPVQDFSSSVNNTYLKANMQEDGVRSYGRMVDLLIAEYRSQQ